MPTNIVNRPEYCPQFAHEDCIEFDCKEYHRCRKDNIIIEPVDAPIKMTPVKTTVKTTVKTPANAILEFGKDQISNPSHYTYSDIETIEVIEAWNLNYNLGCAVKYISRCNHKDNKTTDLKKAIWYLEREITHGKQ